VHTLKHDKNRHSHMRHTLASHDGENRLISVPGNGVTYAYAPDNKRVARRVALRWSGRGDLPGQ
jgi:hypothetical protein